MNKKIKVGIVFGGRSQEHEVSVHSARNIVEALDRTRFEPVLIGIDKSGSWFFDNKAKSILNEEYPDVKVFKSTSSKKLDLSKNKQLTGIPHTSYIQDVDVFFPVLHGPYGEDGTIQGLFEMLGVPYVGSDVLGSAVGMDKDISKRLLIQANLPVVNYLVFKNLQIKNLDYSKIQKKLGDIFFVKPNKLGSSVGVNKVKDKKSFNSAITEAFKYDSKILFEEFIDCREIECSVFGNDDLTASLPGEITPNHEFYSYESKYLDPYGAKTQIPANLSNEKLIEIQELALKTFKTLNLKGLARVDFFINKKTHKIYVNEVNTMPGFTNISMYPKMWEASGVSYTDLITKLIALALE